MRSWLYVMVTVAACGKPTEKKQAEPTKTAEVAKAPARIVATTKSPEARAEYEQGLALRMNQRPGDAIAHIKKALDLDPTFALAMNELGILTPGPDGIALLDKAKSLATTDAEKSWIAAHAAARAGDTATALAMLDQVTAAAPGQWEAHVEASQIATARGDYTAAVKHAEQILAAKPDAAVAYNTLAYGYAHERAFDKAIAAAKKQVELLPKEPNPLDTLGEIQLLAGKFADAEQSFAAVTKLDPTADQAWNGVALARAYRGDYDGAYAAYDQQAIAPRPGAKLESMLDKAWILASQDKLADAQAMLDALDKVPDAAKSALFAYSAIDRGHMLTYAGKYSDAAKWFATGLTRAAAYTDARMHQSYRFGVLRLAALQGKPLADADKLVEEAAAHGASPEQLAYLRGLVAWATSGPRAGEDELVKCLPDDVRCRYDLVRAAKAAGDADGAKAIRQQLLETPIRIPEGVYIKTHPLQ